MTSFTKPEVINQDLTTKEGWENFVKEICDHSHKAASEREFKLADTALVLKRNPMTGEPYPRPSLHIYATHFGGADDEVAASQEAYHVLMRAAAVAGDCIASVFRSEAWVSWGDSPRPRIMPKDDPARKDALVLMIDHREFGPAIYTAYISPGENGKREVGPFNKHGGENEKTGGRFSSMVPPQHMVDNQALVMLSRMYLISKKDNMEPIPGMESEPGEPTSA